MGAKTFQNPGSHYFPGPSLSYRGDYFILLFTLHIYQKSLLSPSCIAHESFLLLLGENGSNGVTHFPTLLSKGISCTGAEDPTLYPSALTIRTKQTGWLKQQKCILKALEVGSQIKWCWGCFPVRPLADLRTCLCVHKSRESRKDQGGEDGEGERDLVSLSSLIMTPVLLGWLTL